MRPKYSVINIWLFTAGEKRQDAVLNNNRRQLHAFIMTRRYIYQDVCEKEAASFYLDHRQHALICDGVGADGEVSSGVAADNPIHCVPVRAVGLISVHHRQVGHHCIHLVFWHLPRKLWRRRRRGDDISEDGKDNIILMLPKQSANAC